MGGGEARSEFLLAVSVLLTGLARNGLTERGKLEILDSWLREIADYLTRGEEEEIRSVVVEALGLLRSAGRGETIRDVVERAWRGRARSGRRAASSPRARGGAAAAPGSS